MELVPISEEHPLSRTCNFVAGFPVLECEVSGSASTFETFYASFGVAIMGAVLDGDCAFDVMTAMLGIPPSVSARKELRIELSNYLIERMGEPWMHDLMVACQELRADDVRLYSSGVAKSLLPQPHQRPQSRILHWQRPSRRMT